MGLPLLHGGQEKLRSLVGRFRVAVCGRRFGKTFFAAREAVDLCEAATKDTRRVVWWISPILEQSRRVERELVYWLIERRDGSEGGLGDTDAVESSDVSPLIPRGRTDGHVGLLPGGEKGSAWKHRKAERALVHVASGSRIEFHSAEQGDRLRGAGLHMAILDEAADIAESIWTNVVKPMLLETRGVALILGTPRGTSNWLYKLYRLGESNPGAPYGSARMATRENPLVPAEDLAVFRVDMSEAEYRQEFEAEFVDGVDSVFKKVGECVGGPAREFGRPGLYYVHGIDLGQLEDYTAIASVLVREDLDGRHCIDGYARFTGSLWSAQCERIAEHVRRFPGPCLIDATGVGRPIVEMLKASIGYEIRPYLFSADSKIDMVQHLAVAFENSKLILPNDKELIGELQSFKQTGWSAARRIPQFGAPSGLHDDGVTAVGLAWWGLTRLGMGAVCTGNPLQRNGFYG